MTERQVIEREREAYAAALRKYGRYGTVSSHLEAARVYPFPKEFREVWTRDRKRCYRFVNGELQVKSIWNDTWKVSSMHDQTFVELRTMGLTMDAVANIYETIADVMRQPTIES